MSHPFTLTSVAASSPINSPARFFAVNEIKLFLAHIITTYDVKLAEGKGVPRTQLVGMFRVPQNADLLFRKR